MMRKLFGTDGIRGVANQHPMNSEMALNVGRIIAHLYEKDGGHGSGILIGQDTRMSGPMLAYAAASGICSMGVDAWMLGTLPTPGVAVMTRLTAASAGIMISASHNPYHDNGIKIFRTDGYKLSDHAEMEIERILLNDHTTDLCTSIREIGTIGHAGDAAVRYIGFLKQSLPKTFSCKGLKIILDCSNGATYQVAPALFNELGAEVITISAAPDGKNINALCGSEHPQRLQQTVLKERANLGLAFDGDGDRLIAVDGQGEVLTGDQILAVCAKYLKQRKELKNNLVVSTIMSNTGLKLALNKMGVDHAASQVGDRYVLEKMLSTGAVLGGEDSGHMIFLNHHTTGDGLLSGLKLIEAMIFEDKPLSELSRIMSVFPQDLINVAVSRKPDIDSIPRISEAIESVKSRLGREGRVLVRYSGTQPVCRVMVEGPSLDETRQYCREIADVIQTAIG